MPEYFIKQNTGKSPTEFFSEPFGFSGSHDKTCELVEAGQELRALGLQLGVLGERSPAHRVEVEADAVGDDAGRLANQQVEYEKQQREIAHIQRYVERFRAKATKARQAQSRLKALQRMEQIAPAHVDSPFRFDFEPPRHLPHPLLRLEGIRLSQDVDDVGAAVEDVFRSHGA